MKVHCLHYTSKRNLSRRTIASTSKRPFLLSMSSFLRHQENGELLTLQNEFIRLPRTDSEARADPSITFSGSCNSTSSVKASPVYGQRTTTLGTNASHGQDQNKDVIQIYEQLVDPES